jgi:hypothetical protein
MCDVVAWRCVTSWGGSEGRSLHWLPRVHKAASACNFFLRASDSKSKDEQQEQSEPKDEQQSSFVFFHADPTEHVNVASCTVPNWAFHAAKSGKQVGVQLNFMPKPYFQAVTCTEANDTGACDACRALSREQDPSVRVDPEQCTAAEEMRSQILTSEILPLCLPERRGRVPLSLCCIMRNEGRYLAEWIEYSRLIGVSRFFLYDHNRLLPPSLGSITQLML